MNICLIKISEIETTAGTQIRAKIDLDTVAEYAEAMSAGIEFPPVIAFHDGNRYVLADGFHRLMAAVREKRETINAEVRKGTKSDALKHALGANVSHGLRRTNADKRRSVMLALAEWPRFSNRQIAKICAVDDSLVADTRRINCGNPAVGQTRVGSDGKERRLPVRVPPPRSECKSGPANHPEHGQPPPSDGNQSVQEQPLIPHVEKETASPPVQSLQDEIQEILASEPVPTDFKGEVRYHVDMVFEDAKIVLDQLDNSRIDRLALEEAATQQFFCAKMLRKFALTVTPEQGAVN